MTEQLKKLTYSDAGVKYDRMDCLKKFAQSIAAGTVKHLGEFGFQEVASTRGESAYVIDMGPFYLAMTPEGLGTKNLIADSMRIDGKDIDYSSLAHDTVAMIVNDLITVGAQPLLVSPHWVVGSSEWFDDEKRWRELVNGWARACNEAGATYGGGETGVLSGIIYPETIELSGAGVGVIQPKERLITGEKIRSGDRIILIESSGIHANGLSLARKIAIERLPQGYNTLLSNGKTFGEALLTPTHIYAKLQQELFEHGIDIHYMVNITGHGFRKLMRSNKRDWTYKVEVIPRPQEEFILMQTKGGITDEEMYATFNMGAGFAFIVEEKDARELQRLAWEKCGFRSWNAGLVEDGPRQVIIEPKRLVYPSDSLGIR